MKPLGKRKCEVLKKIRKMIADANGIKYEPEECSHEGDCRGTCPRCEQEVKYLEAELRKKSGGMSNAAAVFVGSIAAIGSIGMSSCNSHKNQVVGIVPYTEEERIVGKIAKEDSTDLQNTCQKADTIPEKKIEELEGDVCAPMKEE